MHETKEEGHCIRGEGGGRDDERIEKEVGAKRERGEENGAEGDKKEG